MVRLNLPFLLRWYRSISRLHVAAAAIIAVQAVTLYRFASRSYFFADDWLNFSLAQEHGLTRAYLARGVFGHYAPMHRLLDYLVGSHSPPNYLAALCFSLLGYIGTTFLVLRILRYLFGPNPRILLLVSLFGFSTLYLTDMLWWAAALHTIPAIFLGLLCIDGYLRYAVTRSSRALATSVLALGVALLFYEKPLFVPMYLALLTAVVFPNAGLGAAMRAFVKRWPAWVAYSLVCSLYLWNYFANHYYDATLSRPSPRAFLAYLAIAWQEFVSSLFNAAFMPPNTRIHTLATVATQVVVATLIVVSMIRNRSAWRAWVLFFVAFALNAAAVGWGRVGTYGPAVGQDQRYVIENASLFILTLGIAFLPCPFWSRPIPQETRPHRLGAWMRRVLPRSTSIALALICCAHAGMFLASAEWMFRASAPPVSAASQGHVNRIYRDNFRKDLAGLEATGEQVSFYDANVPFIVLADMFYPYDEYSYVLPQIVPHLVFNQPRPSQYAVDDQGHIFPAVIAPHAVVDTAQDPVHIPVGGGTLSRRGDAMCMRSDGDARGMAARFPLSTMLPDGYYFLQFRYRINQPVAINLSLLPKEGAGLVGATDAATPVILSPSDSLFVANLRKSSARSMEIHIEPYAELCISDVHIGPPIPAAP